MVISAFFKSKLLWIVLVIIVIGGSYIVFKPEAQPEYTTTKVEYQNLVQTVSVTGSVRGASEVDLNFETTGQLDKLFVAKGDVVQAGDILAQLASKKINDAISEAGSMLSAAQAELEKLLAGASSQEIAITEQKLKTAEIALSLRKQNLADLTSQLVVDEKVKKDAVASAERDLETTRDNILRVMETELFDAYTAIDTVQDILNDTDKDDTLGVRDVEFKRAVENIIPTLNSMTDNATTAINQAKTTLSLSNINTASESVYQALVQTADMLTDMNVVFEKTPSSNNYVQSEIDSDQLSIQAHHTTISSSISSLQAAEISWEAKTSALTIANNNLTTFNLQRESKLNSAQGEIDSAQAELNLIQAELDFKKTPARSEDVALQRARVSQYASALERVRADLDNITLIAPFTGVVTDINYELGETTSLQQAVISLIGESGLEVEVDIPESDIAKVIVGQITEVTLDAFGEDVIFTGHVTDIDPAETVLQDVVYYKVTVVFDNDISTAKPGMTANIDIITAEKDNVLVVPVRAVKQNGVKYVEVLTDGMVVKKEVVTGLRGDGGLIEIISGLDVGDDVITFIQESK